jgi:hypothetical protein
MCDLFYVVFLVVCNGTTCGYYPTVFFSDFLCYTKHLGSITFYMSLGVAWFKYQPGDWLFWGFYWLSSIFPVTCWCCILISPHLPFRYFSNHHPPIILLSTTYKLQCWQHQNKPQRNKWAWTGSIILIRSTLYGKLLWNTETWTCWHVKLT